MADKSSMELRIKGLEKSMGTMVKAFKELKAGMEALKEKVNKNQEEEIQELIKTQEMLNDMAVTNCEAIKRIDIEIEKHQKQFDYKWMKSIKLLLKRKSANISTRVTVNINLSVNLLIQRRSANHILREGNVKKMLVKTDIPRSVNGG